MLQGLWIPHLGVAPRGARQCCHVNAQSEIKRVGKDWGRQLTRVDVQFAAFPCLSPSANLPSRQLQYR